jgi:hypothetical protein
MAVEKAVRAVVCTDDAHPATVVPGSTTPILNAVVDEACLDAESGALEGASRLKT